MQDHSCPSCRREAPTFDAELAFRTLTRRHTKLAQLVAKHVGKQALTDAVDRIVGGIPAAQGAYPECCLIGRQHDNGLEQWFCTGVLVHSRIVLTAAHCHSPPELVPNIVGLGMNAAGAASPDADLVRVKRVVPHPAYVATGINDLAVLVLRRDSTVKPVPIAGPQDMRDARETTLVGFGNDDVWSTSGFGLKREVTVPILALRGSPDEDLDADEERFEFESDVEFVAGGDGFDTCNGDSGGPAYISVAGRRKVAGLTSRAAGRPVLPCGEGGVYTRGDVQIEFIRQVARHAGIEL